MDGVWLRAGTRDRGPGRDVSREVLGDSEFEDPEDPPEPVVSAKATGIEPTAAPMPSATARAPIRPTYRADPGICVWEVERGTSIARTAPRRCRPGSGERR